MSKSPNKGPVSKFNVPQIDELDYHLLLDTLYEDVFQVNAAATARSLGVSIPTVGRMLKRPPGNGRQWWWPFVLRMIIIHYYKDMKDSSHKKVRVRAQRIMTRIKRAGVQGMMEELEIEQVQSSGATRFLAALILDQPGQFIEVSELKKQGVRGAYSMRTLRRAADRLDLIKDKRGDEMIWRFADMSETDDD